MEKTERKFDRSRSQWEVMLPTILTSPTSWISTAGRIEGVDHDTRFFVYFVLMFNKQHKCPILALLLVNEHVQLDSSIHFFAIVFNGVVKRRQMLNFKFAEQLNISQQAFHLIKTSCKI